MKLRAWHTQLLGIMILLLIFLFAIPSFATRIPLTLKNHLTKHLQEKGYNWVSIKVKGRNIILNGNAPDSKMSSSVLQIAQQYIPLVHINNQMTPRIIQPYSMQMNWNGKSLKLDGYVPQQNNHKLLATAYQYVAKDKIQHHLTLGSGAPEHWDNLINILLKGLLKLKQGHVEITNNNIYISGLTPFSIRREELKQQLNKFTQYHAETHIVATDDADKICQSKFKQLLSHTKIEFTAGKAELNKSSYPLLKKLSQTAALCARSVINIEGHTDNMGSDIANMKLSQQRAQAVVNWLFQQGIAENQLIAIGYGEQNPIADNSTKEGRAKNRRIEFVIKGSH